LGAEWMYSATLLGRAFLGAMIPFYLLPLVYSNRICKRTNRSGDPTDPELAPVLFVFESRSVV
jgi:hypothetical protein